MELSTAKFVTIEGTIVSAKVDTAEQAKVAIKELRHKKKEYAHIKRGLLKQKKLLEARKRPAKGKTKASPPDGFLTWAGTALGALMQLGGQGSSVDQKASPAIDIPKIERACSQTDEIMHNIDAVILQLEGRLIHQS